MRWEPLQATDWYQVTRQRAGSPHQILVALLSADATSFVDHLDPAPVQASEVTYSLEALLDGPQIAGSAYDLTPLDMGVAQTGQSGDILVEWADQANADFFLLDRQRSDQPNRLMLILLPAESVSYLDQQVDAATSYLYNVFAGMATVLGNL